MVVSQTIPESFAPYITDWNYKTYLLVGGYASGKSYATALKIVLELLQKKKKALVVREYYASILESCYDLFVEILDNMGILEDDNRKNRTTNRVIATKAPLGFRFPNGSRIIFKGMDDPRKLKSINDVSIAWLEEASEIKYSGYKELIGRIRSPKGIHFILTCNPVGKENWIFRHFFEMVTSEGKTNILVKDSVLYKLRTLVKNGVYYHYSTVDDNPFVPDDYIKSLDEMKKYDKDLYRVARQGKFGTAGMKVLPNLMVAKKNRDVFEQVRKIPRKFRFNGMDFGFEVSFNALVKMAVDDKNKILYIYDEYYKNHMTDPETIEDEDFQRFTDRLITSDSADPKAIKYYRDMGVNMVGCKKFAGSRLSNTRKMKRFRQIIIAPKCINAVRELVGLTYAVDKNGNVIYDEFNIDSHCFSAMWYGLDSYNVADVKERKYNSKKGVA